MCCFASIDEGWAHGLLEQLEAGAACGTLFSGGGWGACGAQCVGGPRARVLTGFRQERRRGTESARCEQLERRAMVLARTLDCVRGVRLGAKDRLFAELEDEEEAMGARWGRQVGGTVGGESHQVREAFGSATTDACVLCGVAGREKAPGASAATRRRAQRRRRWCWRCGAVGCGDIGRLSVWRGRAAAAPPAWLEQRSLRQGNAPPGAVAEPS